MSGRTTPPKQRVDFDLDAARAARPGGKTMRCAGKVLDMAPSLPIAFMELLSAGQFIDAVTSAFATPADAAVFLGTNPTLADLSDLTEHVFGFPLGEALASGDGSSSTSTS